jgi:hypothetical protein
MKQKVLKISALKRQTDDQELTKWLTHDLPANKQVEIGGRLQRLQQLQRSTDPNERAVATKALEDMDLLIQDAGGGGEVRLESMDLASRKREHPALMGGGGGGGKVTLPPEEVSTLAKALSLGKIDNDSSEKIAHYFDQFNEEFKREAKKSRDELVSYLQSQFNLGKEVSHAITENLHRGLILPDALAHPDIKVKLNPDQVKMVGSERFRSAIEERAKKVFDLGRAQANLHTVNFEENVAVPVKIALNAQPHSIDASQIEATLDKQLQEAQNIAKNISQRKYTLPEIKTQIQAKFSPGIEEVANEDQWREELGKRIGHLVEGIKKLQQEEVLKAIKARNTALDRNAPLKDLLDAARTHYNQDYNIKE